MALLLNFTLKTQNGCSEFLFTDTTGVYDGDDNPGGWGAPNPTTGDVDTATLTIENLTTEITYDDITVTPNSTTTIPVEDLLVDGSEAVTGMIPDGLYKLTYTITIGDDVYTKVIKELFLCNVTCKVRQLAVNVDADLGCGCGCDDEAKDTLNFIEAYTLLKALQFSACCASESDINSNLENLQTFLTNVNCNNC